MHRLARLVLLGALCGVACTAPAPASPTAPPAPAPTPTTRPVAPAVSPAASPAPSPSPAVLPSPSPSPAALAASSPSPSPSTAASPGALATVVGTPVTTGLQITGVQLSPQDATITLQNTGSTVVDLAGWQLRVGAQQAVLPQNTVALPGQAITLHAASGTSSGTDVYLGTVAPALATGLQPGAQVALVDPSGRAATQFTIP